MPGRLGSRKRPKPRPREGKPHTPAIGLGLFLTRAEIQKLKALAASDLRSVPNYAMWLVARDLVRPARKAAFFHLYLGPPETWEPVAPLELKAALPSPRHAVAYILDTFTIVRRHDEQAHGEYRTKRVILAVYDALQHAITTGKPYQTLLDPPPGDLRVAHPLKPRTGRESPDA